MYKKEEASRLRQEFWTTYGQYMSPILSAEGMKVNWVNYKTKVKDIFFRMDADNKSAFIAIELAHKDTGLQDLIWEQFEEFKVMLHSILGEDWAWAKHISNEQGKVVSRIFTELYDVNVFDQRDWPALISFFKPRIIALDEFWTDAYYSFMDLQ